MGIRWHIAPFTRCQLRISLRRRDSTPTPFMALPRCCSHCCQRKSQRMLPWPLMFHAKPLDLKFSPSTRPIAPRLQMNLDRRCLICMNLSQLLGSQHLRLRDLKQMTSLPQLQSRLNAKMPKYLSAQEIVTLFS